jgi:Gas vesicle synthesis protein GvpL/GvpF
MPLYVYAIVRRPVRTRSLSSGTGVRLRPVIGGGAVAIVADCDKKPSPTVSSLRNHDAVVRRIARAVPAILPVRFGTIIDTNRSLTALLETWSDELQPALSLVERREQMTLRLFGRSTAIPETPSPRSLVPETGPETGDHPGTTYLARLATAHARAQSAPELQPLSEALAHIVAAERISRHDTGPLLLTAYHLIPRGKARAYRGILKRRAAALGLRAIASGPWPPYAFVPELHP